MNNSKSCSGIKSKLQLLEGRVYDVEKKINNTNIIIDSLTRLLNSQINLMHTVIDDQLKRNDVIKTTHDKLEEYCDELGEDIKDVVKCVNKVNENFKNLSM